MSATAQHTPGPWTIEDTHELSIHIHAAAVPISSDTPANLRAYYQTIASATQRDPHPVYGAGISAQTCLANARLIASAPELLAACMSALRALEDNLQPGPMDGDAKDGLRAAIARATWGNAS